MARDFLTKQARIGKIIGINPTESEPKLIIYPDKIGSGGSEIANATDSVGGFSTGLASRLANVGLDTFIYIDGIPGSKKAGTANTVTVFGGDVVISGSLYAEGNASSMWEVDPTDSNNLIPTNIIDGDTGLFAMDFGSLSDVEGNVIDYSRYTLSNRNCALDKFFEVDTTLSGYDHIVPKA